MTMYICLFCIWFYIATVTRSKAITTVMYFSTRFPRSDQAVLSPSRFVEGEMFEKVLEFSDFYEFVRDSNTMVSTCAETVENIITLTDCLWKHIENLPLFAEIYLKLRHQMRKHI